MPKKETQTTCQSIFKNGKNTTSKENYTRTWIGLINQLEKNKNSISEK